MTKKSKEKRTRLEILVSLINRWSRPLRIGLATLITIIAVGLMMSVLDLFLDDPFFEDVESVRVLLIILTATGIITYGTGWKLLVGFDWGEPWQATKGSAWFVIAGAMGLLIAVVSIAGSLLFVL